MLDRFKKEAAKLLSEASGEKVASSSVEAGKVGDLSSNIAFSLSREKKENPAKIAAEIAKKLKPTKTFSKIEAAGPYINFYLTDAAYSSIIENVISKKEKYGMGQKKDGKTIIEFPSVNPNKPWHIGHLRNALLGDSVARIMGFDGHPIERMDYINDLGLQVAQSLWGFLSYESDPEGKLDTWLGHQYVGIAKKFDEDKEVMEGVRNILKSLEMGNNDISLAGRELIERCIAAQYQTAFDFSIYHDVLIFESDIIRTIYEKGIEYLKKSKAVVHEKEGKNAGCWVVKLSEDFEKEFGKLENPDKVLIRSDGTAVYTGKDIIFHLWKLGKLSADFTYEPFMEQPDGKVAYRSSSKGEKMDFGHGSAAINVIGVEQKYPQRVIVEVFKRLGLSDAASNIHHLSYEHVGLPEEKFSGRKGTWMGYTADELLEEARKRVLEKIKLDVPVGEKEEIAKIVGAGAIKFSFLRTSSDKKITFRWDEALSMEGDSGPYLQYAFVRTNGILNKSKDKPETDAIHFNEQEKRLLKRLAGFRDMVSRASRELAPHQVAQYALDVAADFSSFYTASPVIKAEEEKVRKTRLAITAATAIVLYNALMLLGIECPERM